LIRGVLVACLSFGLLLGPNVCCCAIALGFSTSKRAELPIGPSCCCKVETQTEDASKSCPFSPASKDECPCKKWGNKDVVPQSASSQAEPVAQVLSKSDLNTCISFEPFNLDSALSPLNDAPSDPRDKGARAHARRSILRC
jgi:hypothetical protein